MARTKTKPVPESNPISVPLYTPWDAARYLRVPFWAVSTLAGRFRGWPEPEFYFRYFWREFGRVRVEDDLAFPAGHPDERPRISFLRLAELFVRAGALQALAEWPQYSERRLEPIEKFQHAVWRGLEDSNPQTVSFDGFPAEEQAEKLAKLFTHIPNESQALLIRKHLRLRLERVEVEDGQPVRIYPPTRDPADTSPRIVALDPRVRFGRPTLIKSGLPTDSLFERYQAGDPIATLARDYDVAPGDVEEVIRYESRPSFPLLPFLGW